MIFKTCDGDFGFDLFTTTAFGLEPMGRIRIPTGINVRAKNPDIMLKIESKSGLSYNKSIVVIGGILDKGFLGEVEVALVNLSTQVVNFKKGEAIAQLVPYKVCSSRIRFETISEADLGKVPSDRGAKGFGEATGTVEGEEDEDEAQRRD